MSKARKLYREGIIVVRFAKDVCRDEAKDIMEMHVLEIVKWREELKTAEVRVPVGKERSFAEYLTAAKEPKIISVSIDPVL